MSTISKIFAVSSVIAVVHCAPAANDRDEVETSASNSEGAEEQASDAVGDDENEASGSASAQTEQDEESSESTSSETGDAESELETSADEDGTESTSGTDGGTESETTVEGGGTDQDEEASETFIPDGNECGLPAWRDFHPEIDAVFALMVGPDANGDSFDLCELAGTAPVLIMFSNPGCAVCESIAEHLSTDGDPTIPDPWVAEVTSNLNDKMAAGELHIINLVLDLADVSKTGLAADWQQRFPHAKVHNLDLQPATGATLTEVIRMCPRGVPSFYYLSDDLTLHTMADPDAQTKEAHWAPIIEANRL